MSSVLNHEIGSLVIQQPASNTGLHFELGELYSDKTFYGFKLDRTTGDCTVEVIRYGSNTAIKIPDPTYSQGADDYLQWFWSKESVSFRFNNSTGHLEMVIIS